jgi:Phytanoyl-CoA dioxygenase (PhyH)
MDDAAASPANSATRAVSPMDDYLFDLRGYLVLEHALEPDLVDDLNSVLDRVPQIEPRAWWGNVQRSDYDHEAKGLEFQNIVEGGEPFERLIDHPSWISHARRYAGEADSYVEGLFIDECFASIRRSGGHFGVHSGGYRGAMRGQYRYQDGVWRCGQVNILMALTDIGPGDGATMIIPGSHKSRLPHPDFGSYNNGPMDAMEGVVEAHLRKGDALPFCGGLSHGASSRTNPGERRVVIYRYGASWASTRHGYRYSDELLARVSPDQRKILQPVPPLSP